MEMTKKHEIVASYGWIGFDSIIITRVHHDTSNIFDYERSLTFFSSGVVKILNLEC